MRRLLTTFLSAATLALGTGPTTAAANDLVVASSAPANAGAL